MERTAATAAWALLIANNLLEERRWRHPLGKRVAVSAVCGSHRVRRAQRGADAHSSCLLANAQVNEARDTPGLEELGQSLFALANQEHLFVQLHQPRRTTQGLTHGKRYRDI